MAASLLGGCERTAGREEVLASAARLSAGHEFNGAMIALKNGVAAHPDDAEIRFRLAVVHLEMGSGAAAEKEVRRALARGWPPAQAMPVLAKSLLLQGRFEQVLADTAQEAAGRGAELLCIRADAHLALQQVDEGKAVFEQVLQRQPGFPTALIGLGRVAYLRHDPAGAAAYAEQVLQADARNIDALMFKGDLLRADGQAQAALKVYDQVIAIAPRHRTVYVERAYLEIAAGLFDAAQADLEKADKVAPDSLLVTYTRGLLEFSRGRHGAAQEAVQKVLRVAPDHPPTLLLAGAVALQLGSLQQAEHHLRRYLDANPDHVYARKLLANALLRSGATPDALAVLEPALKSGQQDVELLAMAGETYMQVRDFNKAVDYFTQATRLDPGAPALRTSLGLSKLGKGEGQGMGDLQAAAKLDSKTGQAGIALARAEIGMGLPERALATIAGLEPVTPPSAELQDLKALAYIRKGNPMQARAALERALAIDAGFFPAAANLAQLDLAERRPDAARARMQSFLERNRNSIDALYALAGLAVREGKPEQAARWLEQAHEMDANAVGPALRLLTHYLLQAQNDKALALAHKMIQAHPDNTDLLDLLGKSQIANGDKTGALDSYKKLAAALPRSAHAQMQVAAMQLQVGNPGAAEDHLKTALGIQPDFPAAQLAQAELYIKRGSYELAMLIADRLQRKYPKDSAGFQLAGDIRATERKPGLALPLYEQAMARKPKSELVVKLASALRAAGKREEAARRVEQWLAVHPDDVRAQLFRADLLLADGRHAQAATQLEAVTAREPANVRALNNLALAYHSQGDRRARDAAERAYRAAGAQAAVLDTLGWILVDQDGTPADTARGVALLQEALAQEPQSHTTRYHLAAALAKAGDQPAARKHLAHLLAGGGQFAEADAARALLQKMQ